MARRGRGPPKNRLCSVSGCDGEAVRSLSGRKVKAALSEYGLEEGRRAYLCKAHYKEYKKATKSERTIDRLTW